MKTRFINTLIYNTPWKDTVYVNMMSKTTPTVISTEYIPNPFWNTDKIINDIIKLKKMLDSCVHDIFWIKTMKWDQLFIQDPNS